MIEMTVEEALEELTQANFHSEHAALSGRITTLEGILRHMTGLARSHAGQIGPMHAWWDSIMDAEAVLKNQPTLHDWNKP